MFNVWTISTLEEIAGNFSNIELKSFLGIIDKRVAIQNEVSGRILERMPWIKDLYKITLTYDS